MVSVTVRTLVTGRSGVGAGGGLAADERDEATVHWGLLQHHHIYCVHHELYQHGSKRRSSYVTNIEGGGGEGKKTPQTQHFDVLLINV